MKHCFSIVVLLSIATTGVTQTNTFPSTGNVGIGTTTPLEKLTIASPYGNIFIGNSLFGSYNGIWLNGSQQADDYNILSSSSDRNLYINRPYGASIMFRQNNQTQMRIAYNGNVAIGDAEPLEKFQIGDRFTFHDGGWKSLMYNAAWNTGLNTFTRIAAGPSSAIYFTDAGNIILQTAPNAAQGAPFTDALHSLIIHNSGQVGIGTNFNLTSFEDASTKLFVQGTVRARKVKIDQATWADFVFANDYQLPTLAEVEKYIKEHKHLKDVPTEQEILKEGLDVGQTQALLLQKIEELTLYIIQLNKKIEQQERKQGEMEAILKKVQMENEQLKKQSPKD